MTGIISWEEPPRRRAEARYDWPDIAADLQSKPGAWAHALTCDTREIAGVTAKNIRESHYQALHGHRYDAKARTVDGEFRVYACYLGPAGAP